MAELEDRPEVKNKEEEEEEIEEHHSVLENPIQISKTDDEDTLVDVHVNNPLKKITKLLEDIKKQKAFSFTIKGSLGIAGIALVVTSFGIFGGTKAFCSRGTQTAIGTVHILKIAEENTESLPLLDRVIEMIWKNEKNPGNRVVLMRPDTTLIHLKQVTAAEAKQFLDKTVFVTGEFDACSQRITVSESNAIQSSR